MSLETSGKDAEERVRFQLSLCPQVAEELERHARELDRSQAWVVAWAIRCALDEPGSLAKWIEKRLMQPEKHQEWKSEGKAGGESRLQVRILKDTLGRLELAATALNQSPQKLAALMVHHSLASSKLALWVLKTPIGKALRRACVGTEDDAANDVVEDQSSIFKEESDEGEKAA